MVIMVMICDYMMSSYKMIDSSNVEKTLILLLYSNCTSFTLWTLMCYLCRCGPLIDLCRGPHVRHTGKIKAMQVTKVNFYCLVNVKKTSTERW